jgi:hypothetical protein
MRRPFLAAMFMASALAVAGDQAIAAAGIAEVVELRLRSRYLAAPATFRITVVVEPDAANRRLQVEADGDHLFRSSELALEGATEKRLHEFEFRALPEGRYTLRVTVYSTDAVRGTASEKVEVVASLQQ